jgi:dihydropteroate synthase
MGVLNLTPDSFSDGGHWTDPGQAEARARQMIDEGVDLIDVGAESTRPGAPPVSIDEELRRLGPVLERLMDCGVPISVDTRKVQVMREVLAMGVDLINDVSGLRDPLAVAAVRDSGAAVCVMHMQGEPTTMQSAPQYRDVVSEVGSFLADRCAVLQQAGIDPDRIVLDPGIGFGKSLQHNLDLLRALERLRVGRTALLVGLSRKSMLQGLTGQPVEARLAGSLGGALGAALRGANLLRVHDVRATRDALSVFFAIAADQHAEPATDPTVCPPG